MHAQCTMYNTNMVCHATRRRLLPMVAWLKKGRKEGRGREREERKAAAPFHYMLRPQPRQEASHSSPPPSAQSEQEREGGRRRLANVSLSMRADFKLAKGIIHVNPNAWIQFHA